MPDPTDLRHLHPFEQDASPAALSAWETYNTLPVADAPLTPREFFAHWEQREQDAFTSAFDFLARRVRDVVASYEFELEGGPAVSTVAVLQRLEEKWGELQDEPVTPDEEAIFVAEHGLVPCGELRNGCGHSSDCALHNRPAMAIGHCSCGRYVRVTAEVGN